MKYLVSVAPVATGEDSKHDWAPEGEPVVPWYPSSIENVFLSTVSFKRVACAKVVETDADPDEIVERLCEQYPGLPDTLHANYVLGTAKAASELPVNTVVRAFIEPQSAKIQDIETENIVTLWEKQPL